jgi:arabinogalactan endo-1,4-beta-galactosidase
MLILWEGLSVSCLMRSYSIRASKAIIFLKFLDPFYGMSATLSNLKSSLTNLINTYDKDVMIAETASWGAWKGKTGSVHTT